MIQERHYEAQGPEGIRSFGSYYHHEPATLVLDCSPLDLWLHEKNK